MSVDDLAFDLAFALGDFDLTGFALDDFAADFAADFAFTFDFGTLAAGFFAVPKSASGSSASWASSPAINYQERHGEHDELGKSQIQ